MRPTFMGFETATLGMMTQQKSLDIVSNNLSNVGTTGYTRQRADHVSLNIDMRYSKFAQNSVPLAGQGVTVYGISQLRDPFLDKRFREEYADVGYHDVMSNILTDVTSAIDEISPALMTEAMLEFETAWNELLQKPGETTNSANILASAEQIVSIFHQMSQKLDNVWVQHSDSVQQEINDINSILQGIAILNDEISKEIFNSIDVGNMNYQPLELLDQRNVLLDELSYYGDITYEELDNGMVNVSLGGVSVVDGDEYETLAYDTVEIDEGYPTVRIYWNDSGEDANFTTGSLRGYLDALNGRGVHTINEDNSNYAQGVLYYKQKIDNFAITFAESFNNVIQIENTDPPQYKTMFTFDNDNTQSAASIRINEEWAANSSYIIENVQDKLVNGGDDNSFAAKVYQLFQNDMEFGEFTGTMQEYIQFYSATKLGNDLAYNNTRLEAVLTVSDDLLNQVQAISGVSMDEEGVDMMMYQKAYDAVARVFTTLDEMLDKLINGTGVVGR